MTEKPLSSEAALRVAPSALFIEGTWIEARSGARMNVEDPATEQITASVPDADSADSSHSR